MTDYHSLGLEELHAMIVAEADQYAPVLDAAAVMWQASRSWLDWTAGTLNGMRGILSDSWKDMAGTAFDGQVGKVVTVAQSWTDGGMKSPQSETPWATGVDNGPTSVTSDAVHGAITLLAQGIRGARNYANDAVRKLPPDASPTDKEKVRDSVAWVLNFLTPLYYDAADKMRGATGLPLSDVPLAGVPAAGPQNGPGPAPGPGTDPGGGGPGAANPDAVNPDATPGPQDDPGTQDPGKAKDNPTSESPLDTAKSAEDVASKLLDLAKSASGGTGNLPDPVSNAFNPADLYPSADPSAVADSFVPQADSGLPGLASAGGGGGLGAGAGGLGGLGPNSLANAAQMPSPGSAIAGVAGAVPMASAATGGSTGLGSTGGIPPMYPPQSGAGRGGGGSGGIRPGAAEQVNAVRSRKPGEKAGVVLSGREGPGKGRNKGKEAPVPAKATKPEEPRTPVREPAEVLDEELWRVTQRSYRT